MGVTIVSHDSGSDFTGPVKTPFRLEINSLQDFATFVAILRGHVSADRLDALNDHAATLDKSSRRLAAALVGSGSMESSGAHPFPQHGDRFMKNLGFPFASVLAQSPDGLLHSIVDDAIAAMTLAETVEDSALAFVNSVPAMIQAAVDAAVANGATAEQLAPFSALNADLTAKSQALQAALTTNTPQAKQ